MQAKVEAAWEQVNSDNLAQFSDYDGYRTEFLRLFGFGLASVDYDADISPLVDERFV